MSQVFDKNGNVVTPQDRFKPASTYMRDVSNWDDSCDNCQYHGESKHYCDLHGITVTDMSIKCCEDFEAK